MSWSLLIFAAFNFGYGTLRTIDVQNLSADGVGLPRTFVTSFGLMLMYVVGLRYGIGGLLGKDWMLYGLVWALTSGSSGVTVKAWQHRRKMAHLNGRK